ncbi:Glutathione-dependent formaldehyde-activating GFA [Pyrenophora seminiperda CCB06]|uniref:Glutathione-dependent formaldehyde-activating GFA n=1 Tax=Pyrenophora seminiperda CCB06 TaxID=1302712 RepID=A0A3M7MBK0_9PLEO|nr:Glutathione-dependent formaldehyde-activating GFA [Pyrenophora seminiperda CCB06]
MKFNLASTIKTVAQRLNPDLEIPNAPAPASPPKNATASRKTPSPPLPQSSFSASSSPAPKRPRASRSASWTKTRNRAASNVSSAFRKSSASIALPVFMGKMPEVDEKMGSEEVVEEDRAPAIVCRDFAVTEVARPQVTGSKKVEAEVKGLGVMEERIMEKVMEGEVMEIPMDSPQRPGTPVDLPMLTVEMADTMLPVLAKLPPITIWEPQETDSVAPVPPPPPPAIPTVEITTLEPHTFPLRVSSLPLPLSRMQQTNASVYASSGYSIQQAHLTHIRGRDNLTCYTHTHAHTHDGDAGAGAEMSSTTTTKHFCKTCGTLMYSVGSGLPGYCTLYLNSVDDALRLGREREMGMKMGIEKVRGGVGGVGGVGGMW